MNYVCSNCGSPCGQDARMGSLDVYLVCECASEKNSTWINDGRGGYVVYKNDATPISPDAYFKLQAKNQTNPTPNHTKEERWDREDD